MNLALVAYTFTKGSEHKIMIHPHGNSKSGQPYQRTMPSTLQLLKEAEYKPAKAVMSAISRKQGGILVRSRGESPWDQKQVYNVRQKRCQL